MSKLTHLDETGSARMVDVSQKEETEREASASASITLSREAFEAVTQGGLKKGDALAVARVGGIMAAKKASELIPLCHPIALTSVSLDFEMDSEHNSIRIIASVKTTGPTGVEMEALTAASVAALTIYDMTKAVDKSASIGDVRLMSKSGGKSGKYVAPQAAVQKSSDRSIATRSRARPSALMSEVFALRPKPDSDFQRGSAAQRDAFRAFMTSRRLRATQWAKDAKVPVAQIYAFLTGKTRSLPADISERLARAARASVEDLFR